MRFFINSVTFVSEETLILAASESRIKHVCRFLAKKYPFN